MYAWIIDKDYLNDGAEGTVGPRNPHAASLETLKAGYGEPLRLYDDDGNLQYEVRIAGNYDGFEPMDDYGRPNAATTEVRYLAQGQWKPL
tara:strand:+ start:418 stop:687 length:270 start_codon:yes stop_codon:yes gene_type:complete